jgi:hypothetical protein
LSEHILILSGSRGKERSGIAHIRLRIRSGVVGIAGGPGAGTGQGDQPGVLNVATASGPKILPSQVAARRARISI